MDAKHGSMLAVFIGGCLTGAAVIALHFGADANASPQRSADADEARLLARPISNVSAALETKPKLDDDSRLDAQRELAAKSDGSKPEPATAVSAEHDTATAEAGNSVADVLTRLEAEYRQHSADEAAPAPKSDPAPSPPSTPPIAVAQPPAPAPAPTRSTVSAPPAAERSASEPPAALPAEASAADARLAALAVATKPAVSAAEETAAAALLVHHDRPSSVDSGQAQINQQQINTQIQQLTIQQNQIVQQFALFQYYQLYPQALSTPAYQKPGRQPRITNSLPPSISATDNPWGFDLPPAPLVH